jgi:hypothetical protein
MELGVVLRGVRDGCDSNPFPMPWELPLRWLRLKAFSALSGFRSKGWVEQWLLEEVRAL